MKSLFSAFLVLFATGVEVASANSIHEATQELAKSLNYQVEVRGTRVKGSTVEEMMREYGRIQGLETDDGPVMNNPKVQDSDEVTFGTTSMKEALALVRGFQGAILEDAAFENNEVNSAPLSKEEMRKHYLNAVKLFQGTGVEFGYNGFGESVCGVIFTTILVIDVKNQKIYELGRQITGPC